MDNKLNDCYPFSKEDVKSAFKNAITTFFERDSFLIDTQASERAQVHCIANYFEEEIQKTDTYRGLTEPEKKNLRVDVEYNRFGIGCYSTKEIEDVCARCYKAKLTESINSCSKFKETHKKRELGEWGNILVDMVFHVRGSQEANIFCLEVKPFGTNRPLECDQLRVKQLTQHDNTSHRKPCYRYGVAMSFDSTNRAHCHLYYLKDGFLQEEEFTTP